MTCNGKSCGGKAFNPRGPGQSCCDSCATSNCPKKPNCMSLATKRTMGAIDSAIDYKETQKETIVTLKDVATNLMSIVSSASECTLTESECFKPEAINAAEQMARISIRQCNGKKIAFIGDGKFYGTVEDLSGQTNLAVSEPDGFGGIRTAADISGNLVFDLSGAGQTTFGFSAGDDVAHLAHKISDKICSKVAVVDGTEVSLKFDLSGATFEMTIHSKEIGDTTATFTIPPGASDADYKTLIEEIKNTFEQYICDIWYDTAEENIRMILEHGFTVEITNDGSSAGVIIFESYLNNRLVTSVTISPGATRVAYGYLLFYSACDIFTIRYPANALGVGVVDVTMKSVSTTDDGYNENVTMNMSNGVWCCKFETVAKICIQYDRCSKNILEIKGFYSWALLVKNMLKALAFDCTNYDVWRRNNVINNVESLIQLLDNLCLIIENQKDLIYIAKCDMGAFNKTCGQSVQFNRCC